MTVPAQPDGPPRAVPWGVATLALVNLFAFGLEVHLAVAKGPEALDAFLDRWGLVPREFLRGAARPGATRPAIWLTPLSAMFLHAGLLHVGSNLLVLGTIGSAVERALGHGRFLLFYLVCGLAAAGAQLAGDPSAYTPSVGASGAVSGVLGAWIAGGPLRRGRSLLRLSRAALAAGWLAVQLASAGSAGAGGGGVAGWAHLGGFAVGAALMRWRERSASWRV